MQNYKITIQYDGTKYQGWQRLKDSDKSIQGKIENVLSEMCGHKIEIHGSGRTDAGVHAMGQVASFKMETDRSEGEICDYLNEYLPEDIAVTRVEKAEERFHARLTKSIKTYVYRISCSKIPPIFERKYVYRAEKELDVEKMKKAASYLVGKHDFLGFSSVKKVKKSTVRTIYDIQTEKNGQDEIKIIVTGDGFLYNMVRIISGTLIEIGQGTKDCEDIVKVFETKKREYAGFTAPPQGLTLYAVEYESGEGQ